MLLAAARHLAEQGVFEGTLHLIFQPAEEGYDKVPMSPEYVAKHKPEVGGYYVVYEDGYKSFSPAGAFESGYTPL